MAKNGNSRDKTVCCSFCGKSQDMVRKLIAGPNNVYICNECTDLCRAIVEEDAFLKKRKARPWQKEIFRNLLK